MSVTRIKNVLAVLLTFVGIGIAVGLATNPAVKETAPAGVRKRLKDPDAQVRLRAAQGLLAVRDADSLPVLIALLDEPAVEISWSAEELLHWVAGEKAPSAKVSCLRPSAAMEKNDFGCSPPMT